MNISQELSQFRVRKAVVLDAAGRSVASVDPYFSATGQFSDISGFSLDRLNATDVVLATFTAYDEQGRVQCSTRRDFTAGPPASGVCSSNFGTPGYALATRFLYRGVTVGAQGYLGVKKVPAENNVGGSTAGSETFYDAAGWARWTTDPEGNTDRRLYDQLGRGTGFVREVAGNVNTPLASSVVLDMMGQVYKRIDPNLGTRRFEYDPNRPELLAKVVFEKTGDEIHYDYDQGRVKTLTQCPAVAGSLSCRTSEALTYQYDVPWSSSDGTSYTHTEGRLAGAFTQVGTTIAFAYDVNGRVLRRDQWLPGFTGKFSTVGSLREDGGVTRTDFSAPGSLTYGFTASYDSAGRPVQISAGSTIHWNAPNVGANTGAYDAADKLGQVTLDGGAVRHTWSYQPYSGLSSAESLAFTGGTAQPLYSVDLMTYRGTKLSGYRDALSQTEQGYWYSDAGRLVSARTRAVGGTTNTALLCMGYSTTNKFGPGPSFGNIELSREAGVTADYMYTGSGIEGTPQAGPDAVTNMGSTLVEYDVYGRVFRTAGGTETFGYDLLNQLTSVTRAVGTSETIVYGPFGEIVSRKNGNAMTYYVGPHATVTGNIAASCASPPCGVDAATVTVDVHLLVGAGRVGSVRIGPGLPSRTIYLHQDRLGSVIATTLSGGNAGASYRYSAHGIQTAIGEDGNKASEIGYAGALRLSGGLLVMGVRVYYPALRIFLQPDPLAPFSYTYVRGDPINHVDPTGMTTDVPPHQCNGGGDTNCAAPDPPPPPVSRGNDYGQTIWLHSPSEPTRGADGAIAVPAGIYEVVTEGRFRYVEDGKTLVGSYIDVQLYYVTDVPTAFMAGSRINAVFGIAASAIEGNAGITRVSIEWLPKLYRETPAGRVFYGNQYVTTRSLARVARAAGWLSLGIGITMDAFNPDVTWEKTGLNAGIGVVGLVGGELAAVGAGAYFAVEAFYPDGWEGFSTDFGNLHY